MNVATGRSRGSQAKRREILDAAARVYARENSDAVTMAQVAVEAGVAVGTLYLYFKDKDELRLAVVESKAARILGGFGGADVPSTLSEAEALFLPDGFVEAAPESSFFQEPQSRREREAAARRRGILEAASRVFAREGFHSATMAQVAAEAGVAVGTLYLYFRRKEDLYRSLVDEKVEELLSHLRAESQRAPRALGKLRRIVVAELQFFARNRDFFQIHFFTASGLVAGPKEAFGDGVDRQYDAFFDLITGIIRQGIDDGDLRDAPPADLACVLIGMVNSVVGKWLMDPGAQSLTAKADWLVQFFSRAAAADGRTEG